MASSFEPRDPDFDQRIRTSFAQQGLMTTFAATLSTIEPGVVQIDIPFSQGLTQQDQFFHGGVAISALDTACGYAALTLMPADRRVLTVELKVNFLSPALGDLMQARGEVIRPGRNITACRGDAYTVRPDGERKHAATILATMTSVAEQ